MFSLPFFIRQVAAVAVVVSLSNIILICWTVPIRGKLTFKCSQQQMVLLGLTFVVEVNMAWVYMYLGKNNKYRI